MRLTLPWVLAGELFPDPFAWAANHEFSGFTPFDLIDFDGKRGYRAVLKYILDRLDEKDAKEPG